jgi:hypothetical protein
VLLQGAFPTRNGHAYVVLLCSGGRVKKYSFHLWSNIITVHSYDSKTVMWYYCAVTGESKKIVFTSGATEKITSGGATSDFWSPHK